MCTGILKIAITGFINADNIFHGKNNCINLLETTMIFDFTVFVVILRNVTDFALFMLLLE